VALDGSLVNLDCGGVAFIEATASKQCSIGIPVARLGDRVVGANYEGSITTIFQSKVCAGG
jgi:hypothetical protein